MSTVALTFLICPVAQAATFTWDGGGADGLWNTGTNWSPDAVAGKPALSDIAYIGSGSVLSPVVTLSGANGNIGQLYIGNNSGSTAKLIISGVTLNANNQLQAGRASGATGTIQLTNGATIVNSSQVGAGSVAGSIGYINLASGTSITAGTVVSGQFGVSTGRYTVTLAGTALFKSNSNLVTRSSGSATGDWTGVGTIQANGQFKADARVTADGGTLSIVTGQYQRDLGISQGDGGRASGYYAINGGKVVLGINGAWGAVGSSNQSLPYTVGDRLNGGAGTQLAVNSVEYRNNTNITDAAVINTEILDPTTIPGLSGVVSAYNLNNLDDFDTNATGIQVRFRYDDFGLDAGTQSTLKLFQNLGSGWTELTGFSLDTANKWITTPSLVYTDGGIGDMGMFAVAQAVPEPSTFALALVALVGLGLYRWRRPGGRAC